MRLMLIPASMFALAAIAAADVRAAAAQPAEAWEIGPVIRGRSLSVGMPLTPTAARRGWFLDFPYPTAGAGHAHYLTFDHGSLTGKRRIVMRYRIDAAPGVRFVPRETPHLPAMLSLYFQRRGDNWTGRRGFENFRWYAPVHTVVPITPGEHQVSVNLNDAWIQVNGQPAGAHPQAFGEALADAGRIGFVLGSHQARGHGVFATGPARLTVISFQVI